MTVKLISREPTQEMLKAIASSDCAPSNYKRMFQAAYDSAPELEQEPVAWRVWRGADYELYFNLDSAIRRTECFIKPRKAEPLYTFPLDAQVEIERHDARIKELEKERAEYMGYSHVDNYIKRQATRIAELERDLSNASARDCRRNQLINEIEQALGDYEGSPADRIHQQAAEISRLKALVGKCEAALGKCKQWREGLSTLTTHNHEAVEEALAAIKEIEK